MTAGPGGLAAALAATETEILSCLVPPREGRVCPRAVNKPSSPYRSRRNHDGPISQHADYTATWGNLLNGLNTSDLSQSKRSRRLGRLTRMVQMLISAP